MQFKGYRGDVWEHEGTRIFFRGRKPPEWMYEQITRVYEVGFYEGQVAEREIHTSKLNVDTL